MQHELTICSVHYSSLRTKKFLELNHKLALHLNPGNNDWIWLIGDQSTEPQYKVAGEKFRSIPLNLEGLPQVKAMHKGIAASYFHAYIFNKMLPYIKTRYVFFCDPDVFVLRKHWIKEVLEHMDQNSLAFFGITYDPKKYAKYRYFPVINGMFVDLGKVNIKNLDFLPYYRKVEELLEKDETSSVDSKKLTPPRPPITITIKRFLRKLLAPLFRDHYKIGASRDAGWKIFKKYAGDKNFPAECAVAVFKTKNDFRGPEFALSARWRMLEKFVLPDKLCFIPKNIRSFTEIGFHELGFFDARKLKWEEHMWRESPFAFHAKRVKLFKTDPDAELETILNTIKSIAPDFKNS